MLDTWLQGILSFIYLKCMNSKCPNETILPLLSLTKYFCQVEKLWDEEMKKHCIRKLNSPVTLILNKEVRKTFLILNTGSCRLACIFFACEGSLALCFCMIFPWIWSWYSKTKVLINTQKTHMVISYEIKELLIEGRLKITDYNVIRNLNIRTLFAWKILCDSVQLTIITYNFW